MNLPLGIPCFACNGIFVIGYTLCFALMGALVVQSYVYFARFTDDRRAIKALVTAVLLLETLMTAFVFSGFWKSSVDMNIDYIGDASTVVSSFVTIGPIAGLVTTLTQNFYCWRIWSLRRSRLILSLITVLSLVQLSSIVVFSWSSGMDPGAIIPATSIGVSPWLVTWLGSSVVCDFAITICMILSLRSSQSYFRNTKSALVKLTRLSVETGLVTTVAALLELIIGIVYKEEMYHVAVFYALSKLYANCLLATLNFRLVLRKQSDPNLTEIVWDDMETNIRSTQSSPHQSMRVM